MTKLCKFKMIFQYFDNIVGINNVGNLFGWTIIQITPIQFKLNFHNHRVLCIKYFNMKYIKYFFFVDCRFWQGFWRYRSPRLKGYVTSMLSNWNTTCHKAHMRHVNWIRACHYRNVWMKSGMSWWQHRCGKSKWRAIIRVSRMISRRHHTSNFHKNCRMNLRCLTCTCRFHLTRHTWTMLFQTL